MTGKAYDAAGNSASSAPVTAQVDNTAPTAPTGMSADTGEGWSNVAARSLSWTNPSQAFAPITTATTELCDPDGGCTQDTAATTSSDAVELTEPGVWTARAYLTDAAGNANSGNTSSPYQLRLDQGSPPAPALGTPVQQASPDEFAVSVTTNDPGPAPTSLRARLCDTNGANCGTPFTPTGTTQVPVKLPAPGSYRLQVRTVDDAGNSGPESFVALTYAPATPTPTADPTASPTATPTATPPIQRTRPRLMISKVKLTKKRLRFRVGAPLDATRRLTIVYRVGKRIVRRHPRLNRGRADVSIKLKRRLRARHGRLRVSYAGDSKYLPSSIGRKVVRRPVTGPKLALRRLG